MNEVCTVVFCCFLLSYRLANGFSISPCCYLSISCVFKFIFLILAEKCSKSTQVDNKSKRLLKEKDEEEVPVVNLDEGVQRI